MSDRTGSKQSRATQRVRAGAVSTLIATAAVLSASLIAPSVGSAVPLGSTESALGTGGLNPALALAYTLAETEAHNVGVPLSITSGYRTYEEQEQLWINGINTYGGPDNARRWVLPPNESSHVAGDAIDVGPISGAQWLQANGNRWGLCRMYENEWWHFELATVPGGVCPAMLPDASWG